MGTRCGDVDPGMLPFLADQGMSIQDIDKLMNKQSGLLGITGYSDLREVEERAAAGDYRCQLAQQVLALSAATPAHFTTAAVVASMCLHACDPLCRLAALQRVLCRCLCTGFASTWGRSCCNLLARHRRSCFLLESVRTLLRRERRCAGAWNRGEFAWMPVAMR
jgi:hypothetical protein